MKSFSVGRLVCLRLGAVLLIGGVSAAQEDDFLREQGLHGFALEAGEVALPRFPPGAIVTEHRANVEIPDDGRYRFYVETSGGSARLSITTPAGEVVSTSERSEWIELPWGEVALTLGFEGQADARQRVRVLWEREWTTEGGFLPEPLPFDAWRPVNGIVRADSLQARVLLEQKGCTNCHLPSGRSIQAVGQRQAPDLKRVGGRLGKAWMKRWIQDPNLVRPGADMPGLFSADEGAEVDAIVAYLAGLRPEEIELSSVATETAVIDEGRQLYHGLGCVACHGALESMAQVFKDKTLPSQLPAQAPLAPFGDLQGKWMPAALSGFLQAPARVYPDGRMPSMDLEPAQADLLATYLLSLWGQASFEMSIGDEDEQRRGMELFESKGCGACHLMEEVGAPAATHLNDLRGRGGCLDGSHTESPNYGISEEEASALERAVVAAGKASGAPAPLDQARRRMQSFNCFACHSMNGAGGPAEALQSFFQVGDERVDLGDEGRLPPDLSGMGWKLTSNWLYKVLVLGARARPYLMTRMPNYGAQHVALLPDAIARLEGLWPGSDVESPEVTDAEVLVGREMMGRGALSCVTCHSFGDLDPLGSPGPAIDQFGERLRYEWARSFLRAPQRFKPGSRMPDFYSAGKSTLHSIYDGDLGRQVDAMWAYFGLGEFMPPPPGMEAGKSLQVLVGERPIVMRAFLEGSGSRAIAVGNPNGAHYAFDAEKICLSEIWQGDFVDASGSWAGRGGSTLGGMGEGLWEAGEGVPLQLFFPTRGRGNRQPPPGGAAGGLRFRGYRLGADGQPSFLYDAQGSRVEERVSIELLPQLRVTRFFRIAGEGVTGVTINAMSHMSPRPRFRFDGGEWVEPSSVPALDGRSYFHQVIPDGTASIEVELELRP